MANITQQISIDSDLETVRAALLSPDGIRGWWAKDGDIGDGVGAEHELRFQKEGRTVVMRFRVDSDEPVRWTCLDNGNPVWPGTTLEFRAEAAEGGVAFTLVHDGFAEDQSPPFQMTRDGWGHFVSSLKAYCETGTGQPW